MQKQIFSEIKDELLNDILPYWQKNACDTNHSTSGFYGKIDNDNVADSKISRSIVMTSRFLWAYSAAARLTKNPEYLKMADFAYETIINKFWDKKNSGVYWSVKPDGTPDVSKKQIYGEAFCCYGLSEYAAALKELRETSEKTENSDQPQSSVAMDYALDLYNLLEEYAYDKNQGGYVEARAINWKETDDMILSPKDMNCPKSMNTNLHVMEAYTNLYRTLPVVYGSFDNSDCDSVENSDRHSDFQMAGGSVRAEVGESLSKLVRITVDKILQKNGHLGMFFDMDWNLLMDEQSYGHDIEASWLLWEAATELCDEELKNYIHDTVLFIADVTLKEGFDSENGATENFLRDGGTKHDRTRVWWNQAEGLNGFYNAWEMTGDEKYEKAVELQWNWIKNHQIDKKGGEWWNSLDVNGNPILEEDKGGNWKTAYHSGRACMELLRRSKTL